MQLYQWYSQDYNKGNCTVSTLWLFWINQKNHQSIINTLRLRINGHHFADNIFKYISLNGKRNFIQISTKYVLEGPISNKPALNQIITWCHKGNRTLSELMVAYFIGAYMHIPAFVQIMGGRWPGNKPLSEPMMVTFLTHICRLKISSLRSRAILYSKCSCCQSHLKVLFDSTHLKYQPHILGNN